MFINNTVISILAHQYSGASLTILVSGQISRSKITELTTINIYNAIDMTKLPSREVMPIYAPSNIVQ